MLKATCHKKTTPLTTSAIRRPQSLPLQAIATRLENCKTACAESKAAGVNQLEDTWEELSPRAVQKRFPKGVECSGAWNIAALANPCASALVFFSSCLLSRRGRKRRQTELPSNPSLVHYQTSPSVLPYAPPPYCRAHASKQLAAGKVS